MWAGSVGSWYRVLGNLIWRMTLVAEYTVPRMMNFSGWITKAPPVISGRASMSMVIGLALAGMPLTVVTSRPCWALKAAPGIPLAISENGLTVMPLTATF